MINIILVDNILLKAAYAWYQNDFNLTIPD